MRREEYIDIIYPQLKANARAKRAFLLTCSFMYLFEDANDQYSTWLFNGYVPPDSRYF